MLQHSQVLPKPRLIVLVPEGMTGNADLSQKIQFMALHENRDVLYLAMVEDASQLLTASRQVATLKALTASGKLQITSRIVLVSAWLETLKSLILPGDVVITQAGQTVRQGLFGAIPLNEYLSTACGWKASPLEGFYNPRSLQVTRLLREFLYWGGFLGIFILFSALEIDLGQQIHGATRTMLLLFVLMLEFGSAVLWNKLVSR